MKSFKKVLLVGLMLVCGLTITSCGTDAPTTTQEPYPHMDYMYREVYAIKWDSWDTGRVGMVNVDDVVGSNLDILDGKSYPSGFVFAFKENVTLKSVTFTVTAHEDCYMTLKIVGKTDDGGSAGKFSDDGRVWFNEGDIKTYTLTYGNGTSFVNAGGRTSTWLIWDEATTKDQRRVQIGANLKNRDNKSILNSEKVKYFSLSNFSFEFE